MIPWNYKNREAILDTEEVGGVPYLSFRALKKTGLVADGFSTQEGMIRLMCWKTLPGWPLHWEWSGIGWWFPGRPIRFMSGR